MTTMILESILKSKSTGTKEQGQRVIFMFGVMPESELLVPVALGLVMRLQCLFPVYEVLVVFSLDLPESLN